MRRSCETCMCFEPDQYASSVGTCHRYAPRPVENRDARSTWPRVLAIDWCAEFADASWIADALSSDSLRSSWTGSQS